MNNPNQNEINNIIKNGANKQDVERLMKNLSAQDSKKINDILNDKQATERLLADPKVQALMKKLLGGKK